MPRGDWGNAQSPSEPRRLGSHGEVSVSTECTRRDSSHGEKMGVCAEQGARGSCVGLRAFCGVGERGDASAAKPSTPKIILLARLRAVHVNACQRRARV